MDLGVLRYIIFSVSVVLASLTEYAVEWLSGRPLVNLIYSTGAFTQWRVKVKSLPNLFFKSRKNYVAFHRALLRVGCFSREMPDVMTLSMSKLCESYDMCNVHIEHWHNLTDEDTRTIRNILRVDVEGNPVSQSREFDLINYMSMCLQHVDTEYADYVDSWCHRRIMCLDMED